MPRSAHSLFPVRPGIEREQLQIHEVGRYSISRPADAEATTGVVLDALRWLCGGRVQPSQLSVLDATACVGGNTLSFAETFGRVTAVERDRETCAMLDHNLRVYKLRSKVRVLCGDALGVTRARHDVVFLDPPWNAPGQPWHSTQSAVRLSLSGRSLPAVIRHFLGAAKPRLLVVKVPLNYDFGELQKGLPGVPIGVRRLRRFYLVIVVSTSGECKG